jgi:Putative prokaryotic signal transducing protein
MDRRVRMAPLTWVAGAFRARVLAARLESEGIDAQLRGAFDSPYGLTMGDLARVDVYVPEDQLEDARYVLLADEVDATLTAPTDWCDDGSGAGAPTVRRGRWVRWGAAALLAIAVVGTFLGAVRHW